MNFLGKLASEYAEVGKKNRLFAFYDFVMYIFIAKEKLAHVAEDVKVSGTTKIEIGFFI